MDWMKILSVVAGVMMLAYMWPAYKHWSKNSPKAEAGDWQSVILVILGVAGFVALLVVMVR